jgi:broad specificity phosphatase PhoE
MSKTNFILVRHGESLGNAAKIVLGHSNMDLSDLGYAQANTTAEYLSDRKIDEIYSSDLLRAYNTALPHAKIRNLEVKTSKNLREVYVGEWESRSVTEIREKYGDMYDIDWVLGFGTFRFPAGESTIEAGKRFYDEMAKIAEQNCGKTVLVAAHAAVIRAFWAIIANIAPENVANELPFPTNASYSLLSYENNEFLPGAYSCDSHLEAVGITGITGVSH